MNTREVSCNYVFLMKNVIPSKSSHFINVEDFIVVEKIVLYYRCSSKSN